MKKHLALLLAAAMILSMSACSGGQTEQSVPQETVSAAPAEGKMTPGTYSFTTRGFAEDITVEVTVDEDSILDVVVAETHDSLGIGEMAEKELAKAVVEKQSTKLDGFSGATISSSAFLYAVREALKEAGAAGDSFSQDCTTTRFTDRVDPDSFQADVIVVGGGLAGVASAMAAVESGAKVLVVEQTNYLGGTSMYAGGAVAESGSTLQPSESHNAVTADSLYTWLTMSNAENPNFNAELARAMADASGPAYDKLVEWGMKPTEMTFFGNGAGYYVWQDTEYTSTGWQIFHNLEGTMSAMVDNGDLAFAMKTKAVDLVCDDAGAVVGVTTQDGKTYTAGAVILATGGFTNNQELMEKIYSRYGSYGAGSATGEMLVAAMGLGAKTYAMDLTRWEPGMVNVTGKNNEQVEYEVVVANSGYVWVNKDGQRVSVEDAKNAKPWKSAQDNTMYILLDQELVDAGSVLKLGNASNTQLDPENRNFYRLLEEGSCIWSGDTVEEVAKKAGVDAAGLAATVERYNGFCEAGVDEDFDRAPENLKSLKDRFYLIETIGGVKGTSGGIVEDAQGRVLDTGDQVIPGLYAAGEIGGTLAYNGNCVYNGGCFIICNSFGSICGANAAAYALKG